MFTRDGVPVAGAMGDMLAADTAISAGSGGVGTVAQAEAVGQAVQVAESTPWIGHLPRRRFEPGLLRAAQLQGQFRAGVVSPRCRLSWSRGWTLVKGLRPISIVGIPL
jgi:hypothetical protein